MTFILISGKTGVGKTSVCNKLHELTKKRGFQVVNSQQSGCNFIANYSANNKHIVLSSASDDNNSIMALCQYIDNMRNNNIEPDIVITTIRETDNNNYQMSRMLAVLEEIAKGTPNLATYFNNNIAGQTTPFLLKSLSHHAFVLHLEKQNDANGEELKDDNDPALDKYWKDSAETVKAVLDIALT